MEVDDALDVVGGFKRWHLAAFVLLSASGMMPICLQSLGIIFIGWVPPYHCSVPDHDQLNQSLPRQEGSTEYETCKMYVNITTDNSTTSCQHGYQFYSDGYTTIATEFELVCEAEYYPEMAQTIYLMGTTVSNLIGSYFIDRFGRKKLHIIGHFCLAVLGSAVSLAPNYFTFVIIRTLCGMITVVAVNSGLTLLLELFGTKKRAFAGVGLEFVWVAVYMIPCLIGYFLLDWRINQLVSSLLSLIWLLYIWFLEESVPWLVAKHRFTEAEDVLKKMARLNGIKKGTSDLTLNRLTVSEAERSLMDIVKGQKSEKEMEATRASNVSLKPPQGVPIKDLFCDSKLRLHLLASNFFWFTNVITYYVLVLATPNLGPNRFISYIVGGIVEIPAYAVSLFVVNRYGRRKPTVAFYIITAISLGAAAVIPKTTAGGTDLTSLTFTFVMAGKFGTSGAFAIMYLFMRELFPTTLRSSSSAWGRVMGEVGAMLSPPFSFLVKHMFWLPNATFAVLSVCSAVITLMLPETMNKPLPITTQDVHTIYYPKTQKNDPKTEKNQSRNKKIDDSIVIVVNGKDTLKEGMGDALKEEHEPLAKDKAEVSVEGEAHS